jgi:pimeloyl-ACP methyl ester carboxylesterase
MLRFPLFLCAMVAWAAPCTEAGKLCEERVKVSGKHFLQVYRSHPLTRPDPSIERAFVLVHSTLRDGHLFFTTATKAAQEAGAAGKTLVVAPQFRASGGRCKDAVARDELRFTCDGWKDGDAALKAPADSFAAMDALLRLLDDRAQFPNLTEIVVAGHSAGGQYVQRYAAANRVEPELRAAVRYLVANPSSYLYLDSWRPVPAESCAGFDRYRFGLLRLRGYAAQTGARAIRSQYPKRDVTYLLGELDTTDEHHLDKTCPAMVQGPNRYERGQAYARHLAETTGAQHPVLRIPGCAHSADCMYRSEAACRLVFGGKPR